MTTKLNVHENQSQTTVCVKLIKRKKKIFMNTLIKIINENISINKLRVS